MSGRNTPVDTLFGRLRAREDLVVTGSAGLGLTLAVVLGTVVLAIAGGVVVVVVVVVVDTMMLVLVLLVEGLRVVPRVVVVVGRMVVVESAGLCQCGVG